MFFAPTDLERDRALGAAADVGRPVKVRRQRPHVHRRAPRIPRSLLVRPLQRLQAQQRRSLAQHVRGQPHTLPRAQPLQHRHAVGGEGGEVGVRRVRC